MIFGVFSDEVRKKLIEPGAVLTVDQALLILRTTEAASKESTNLKRGDAAAIHATSTHKQKNSSLNYSETPGPRRTGNRSGITTHLLRPNLDAGTVEQLPVAAPLTRAQHKGKSATTAKD